MGTWIEIPYEPEWRCHDLGRSLQWERGLKSSPAVTSRYYAGRSLQWERGLKSFLSIRQADGVLVVPCNGNVD